jgi:hypothetical protein
VPDRSHQIGPSAAVLARDLERQLRAIGESLATLEHDLKEQPGGPPTRSNAIALAREHVQAAIDELEIASRQD